MAVPENLGRIKTNISRAELIKFWEAYDTEMKEVPNSHNLFAGSRFWQMKWKGDIYTIHEDYEEVDEVWKGAHWFYARSK